MEIILEAMKGIYFRKYEKISYYIYGTFLDTLHIVFPIPFINFGATEIEDNVKPTGVESQKLNIINTVVKTQIAHHSDVDVLLQI